MYHQDKSLEISPADAAVRLATDNDAMLVDVREDWEYVFVHLPDATLIPLSEFEERYTELPSDRDLLIYCHHGIRSLDAVRYLREQGYTRAWSIAGGIDRWSRLLDPDLPRY